MPPSYGTIDRSNLPGAEGISLYGASFPLFAKEEVLYRGQTILLLYGPEEDQVLRFRDEINIAYETDYSFLGFKGYAPEQIYRERLVRKTEREGDGRESQVIKDHFHITPSPRRGLTAWGP